MHYILSIATQHWSIIRLQ